MTPVLNPFEAGPTGAAEYDAWYESAIGRLAFEAEARCVRELLGRAPRPWLEVGAGSGRFGGNLHVEVGLDPAIDLLGIAATRIPSVVRGVAEALPFRDAGLGAILAVAAFEFVADARRALYEASRVLRTGGLLVVGFIPRGGAWGQAYQEQGRDPTSVFHQARFFVADELVSLAAEVGLRPIGARSALFAPPDDALSGDVADGALPEAGFVALAFEATAATEGDAS